MSKFSISGQFIYLLTENFLTRKLGGKVCILHYVHLSVHFHLCCFYMQYHRGIREITSIHASIDILFYMMSYIINMMKIETLDSFIRHSYFQYKRGHELNLHPPPPPVHYLQLRSCLDINQHNIIQNQKKEEINISNMKTTKCQTSGRKFHFQTKTCKMI